MLLNFRQCLTEHHGKCHFIVHRDGITLESKSEEQSWAFSSLIEMRKEDDPDAESTVYNLRKLGSRSAEMLHFIFLTSELRLLIHPVDRDRAFNLILAWSGLKWQSLQMERHKGDFFGQAHTMPEHMQEFLLSVVLQILSESIFKVLHHEAAFRVLNVTHIVNQWSMPGDGLPSIKSSTGPNFRLSPSGGCGD